MFTRLDKLWRKHSSTFTEVPAYRSLVSGAQSARGIKHDDEDFIEGCSTIIWGMLSLRLAVMDERNRKRTVSSLGNTAKSKPYVYLVTLNA